MEVWGKFVHLVGFVEAGVNGSFKMPASAKPWRYEQFEQRLKTVKVNHFMVRKRKEPKKS